MIPRGKETKPDEVVEFGSERYDEILKELAAVNRQAVLSLGGEVWFEAKGKVVKVTFAKRETGK